MEKEGLLMGDSIRQMRTRLGLTQEELARHIGVTVGTVNRWENSVILPSKLAIRAIRAFAEKHNVSSLLLGTETLAK